jgi:flagellar assembly protein FliH
MTSTSSDRVIARDLPTETISAPAHSADLRSGDWTRLGSGGVLGDAVTEAVLGEIAEQARQTAQAQGYATGWAEGRRVANARAAEEAAAVRREADAERARRATEHQAAMAALDTAVDAMRTRVTETVEALAGQTVDVALELTRAILGREVITATDPGGDALRRALSLVDPQVSATVRLHPADRAALDPTVLEGREVAVVADPTLERGDAVAETADTLVDATIAAALERVREVLAG